MLFSVPIDLFILDAAQRTPVDRIVALRQIEVDDSTRDLDVFEVFQKQAQHLDLAKTLTGETQRMAQGQVREDGARRFDFPGDFF